MPQATPGRAYGVPVSLGLVTVVAVGALVPATASAVVAGARVSPADHPAVVQLADACTATLVAPRRLLTAGHCIPRVTPGRTRVSIGGERLRVVRVARHPRFQYLTPTYPAEPYRDVALAELEADAPVAPVRVSWRPVRPGAVVTLLGYGTGDPGEPGNFGVLRTATLVVRDDRTCRREIRRAAPGQARQYRRRVMLCTQDPDGVRPFASGCYGDSGAPLLRGALDDDPAVVGVDSWGVACGDRDGDPEVFARVAAERAFVEAADPGWTTAPIEQPFAPGRL
ncbi:trypsin-like serine protease [Patulibacter sp.]|uniref:S1 family peptidase n=1 Tax=Patulibacter sp. TaxID=1912859 RepID=UPI0027278E8F|nr:trypsin-like serine protease [Patulibacter sp.]MDO9409750.1 trypsin-like serine protease [Patulibacter sp.]